MQSTRFNQIRQMVTEIERGDRLAHPGVLLNLLRELLPEVKVESVVPTPQLRNKIDQLLKKGLKINAIKEYRAATGIGLLEAKLFIESLMEDPKKTRERWNRKIAYFEAMEESVKQKKRLRHRPPPKKKRSRAG